MVNKNTGKNVIPWLDTNIVFGRLEVLRSNSWGTVTNQNFSEEDVKVACRQLGLEPGRLMSVESATSGPIWMDDLHCTGSEKALRLCTQTSLGSNHISRGKSHSQDVGV